MSAPGRPQALIPEPHGGEGTPVSAPDRSQALIPEPLGGEGTPVRAQATVAPVAVRLAGPRRTAWVNGLVALLAIGLLTVLALGVLVNAMPAMPVSLSVGGERVFEGLALAEMPPAHKVVLAGVVLLAALAALIVIPLALLLGALAAAVALLAVVVLPLALVALLLAVLLSPLWLLAWGLWRAAT